MKVKVKLLSRVRLPGSSVHGILQAMNTGVGCHALPGNLLNSGIEPSSPALQADALSSEPPGKLVIVTAYFNYLLLNFASKINFYFYILSIFHSLKQKYSLLLTSLEGQKYVISSKRSLNNFHN